MIFFVSLLAFSGSVLQIKWNNLSLLGERNFNGSFAKILRNKSPHLCPFPDTGVMLSRYRHCPGPPLSHQQIFQIHQNQGVGIQNIHFNKRMDIFGLYDISLELYNCVVWDWNYNNEEPDAFQYTITEAKHLPLRGLINTVVGLHAVGLCLSWTNN